MLFLSYKLQQNSTKTSTVRFHMIFQRQWCCSQYQIVQYKQENEFYVFTLTISFNIFTTNFTVKEIFFVKVKLYCSNKDFIIFKKVNFKTNVTPAIMFSTYLYYTNKFIIV